MTTQPPPESPAHDPHQHLVLRFQCPAHAADDDRARIWPNWAAGVRNSFAPPPKTGSKENTSLTINLDPAGKDACTLKEVTNSTSNEFTVPIAKDALVTLLTDILREPEKRMSGDGPVRCDRLRDGLRVSVGNGAFILPYPELFPLVMG